jgi:ATP-dependent helicase/nuclease subunit B
LFKIQSDVDGHLRGGGTLLVPTPQRVRAVQLAYAAAQLAGGSRVWASPDVLTPAQWARRECERCAEAATGEWPRVLGASEEWLLWRHAAQETLRDLPFLDAGTLGDALQRSSERAADYGLRISGGPVGSEAQLLYQAHRLVEARSRELKAAPVSALAAKLAPLPRTPLWLRGFDARLPPRLAALAGTPVGEATRPAADRAPRALRTPDGLSQMEAIAAWCRERLDREADARLLVVLPGTPGERQRLAALIQAQLDAGAVLCDATRARPTVSIEGGESFDSLVLPSHALIALDVLSGAEVAAGTLGDWLMSPYWERPHSFARAALASVLRQHAPTRLGLRELHGALQLVPPQLKPAAQELDSLLRRAAGHVAEGGGSPRRWAECFSAALAALTWPGSLPADSAVHQTRLRWGELLEEFGELAASVARLARAEALDLLRALARRTAYRPADDDAPVTISPMLADPVVIYDGIWVANLSADVLPQPVAPDPFLPHRAQLAARMPEASPAGRRAQAETLLAAWRAGARELVLSVPARDKDLELLPSPCLARFALQEDRPPSCWLGSRIHQAGCTETLPDTTGTTYNALAPLPSGTRALTLQSACPFRAYAELRLGAEGPELAEPGVPMDQRGLLLHAALQGFWERLGDSRALAALDEGARAALIAECVRQAATALSFELRGRRRRRRPPDTQFDLFTSLSPALERECRRAQALIGRLCTLELARAPFTVEATEHTTELALSGGRLRMRLDRVDRLESGRAVLDYKSGRPGSPDWYGERPTHPQLLAYAAALGEEGEQVVALATVNLTAREVRFTGVAAAAELLPRVRALPGEEGAPGDWVGQLARWRELIGQLIRAFLAGEARVDPAPGACDHCHLADLCRIGAHLAPEAAAHADEVDE